MSVGNLYIDKQHKTLVKLINKLNIALSEGRAQSVMVDILNELATLYCYTLL